MAPLLILKTIRAMLLSSLIPRNFAYLFIRVILGLMCLHNLRRNPVACFDVQIKDSLYY